jgi:hypothetical protein
MARSRGGSRLTCRGFELYLQFDSLRARPLVELRGEDLSGVRERALERLNEHNISTTLVVTLKKGLNDNEIGEIIDFALKQRCVRGVTFQPIQHAGRSENFDARARSPDARRDPPADFEAIERVSAARRRARSRVIPTASRWPTRSKMDGCVTPLTGMVDPQLLLHGEGNTIMYEQNKPLRELLFKLFSTGASPPAARHHCGNCSAACRWSMRRRT